MEIAVNVLDWLKRLVEGFLAYLPLKAIIPVVVVAFVCIGIVYLIDFFAKINHDNVGNFLRQSGFKPVTSGVDALISRFDGFKLILAGEKVKAEWAAESLKDGIDWLILEYRGVGSDIEKFKQTVIRAQIPQAVFPAVFIGPRYFFGMERDFSHYLEVTDKDFSRFFNAYTIKSGDPELVRKVLITPEITLAWEKVISRNRIVEVKADTILLYNSERSSKVTTQDRLRQFQEAEFVVKTFCRGFTPV